MARIDLLYFSNHFYLSFSNRHLLFKIISGFYKYFRSNFVIFYRKKTFFFLSLCKKYIWLTWSCKCIKPFLANWFTIISLLFIGSQINVSAKWILSTEIKFGYILLCRKTILSIFPIIPWKQDCNYELNNLFIYC